MGSTFKRLLVAIPFTLVLTAVLGYAAIVAWAPVPTEVTKKEGDKEITAIELAGHQFQRLDFWVPVAFVAMCLVLLSIMLYVSSDRSRVITGALVGTATAVGFVILANIMLRWAAGGLVWQGARFAGAFAAGLVLLTAYGAIAVRLRAGD